MQNGNQEQNPREAIVGVKYDPKAVDAAIDKQNNAQDAVAISPEQVAEAREDAADSAARTLKKSGEATIGSIDSKNAGVGGTTVKDKIAFGGGITPINASAVKLRGTIAKAVTPVTVVADVDEMDRMQHMAESGYAAIQSEVLEEAVAGTENSDEKIIGLAQDNNVYSEETTIMAETVTRRTKKYGQEHPRHRASGTVFTRKAFGLSISGDSYDLETDAEGELKPVGTVYHKNWHLRENFLLNRLGSDGGYIANEFIMPKTGYFRLKGINPFYSGPRVLTKIGQVKRQSGEGYVLCGVYQARGNGIFEVEDVTPLVSDATHAVEETVELITANKGKMKFGQAEAVANLFAALANKVDDRGDYLYPELNLYRNRSSIGSVAGVASVDTSLSCKNDLAQYVNFMHSLSESEIFFIVQRLNVMNEKDNLKMFKGFEGMQDVYSNIDKSYWANVFKAKPSEPHLKTPTMAAYLASFNSTKRFNRAAALVYGLREFWAKLEAQCQIIDEGDIKTAVMANVRVQRDAVEKLALKLAIGTTVDPENSTSDATVHLSDVGSIILNFDPNDLFDFVDAGFDTVEDKDHNVSATDFHINVFPSAGYVNVFTGQGGYLAEASTYFVLPVWMDALRRIMNSQTLRDRLLKFEPKNKGLLQYFYHASEVGKYLPIKIDLVEPSWFTHYFLEGLREVKDVVLSVGNSQSGMFRFMSMLKEYGNEDVYDADTMSLSDALAKLIDNPYLHVDPHARTIADFKKLSREAIIDRFYEPENIQIGLATNIDLSYFGLGEKKSMVILAPSRFGHYVSNLEGWKIFKPNEDGTDKVEVYASNVQELLGQFPVNSEGVAKGLHLWPSKQQGQKTYLSAIDPVGKYQILLASTSNYKKDTPVLFKRMIDSAAGATVMVGTANADPRILDFQDNPDMALYGHDGFQNLVPCDAFVLVRRVGSDISASGNLVHNEAEVSLDDYMLCPVLFCDHTGNVTDSAAFSNTTGVKYVGFYSRLGKAVNALYQPDAKINAAGEVTPTTLVRCRKRSIDESLTVESEFIRLMRLPTLYGYERFMPGNTGFTAWRDGAIGLTQEWAQSDRGILIGASGRGSHDGMSHTQFMAFYPEDFDWPNGDGQVPFTAISQATVKIYLEERFGVKITDASDFKWYNHQRVLFVNVQDDDMVADMKTEIETLAVILSKPLQPAQLNRAILMTDTDIATDRDVVVDNQGDNARYVLLGEETDVVARQKFIDRYIREFGELLYWPIRDYLRYQIAPFHSGAVDRPQYVFFGEVFEKFNPDLISSLKYNDIRAYYTDKPAVRLNVGWEAMGMTECLLAKRFRELG